MIETIASALLHFVESLGYPGIFIMATIESTFIPVPSELTMIPAGYLVHEGKLNGALVFLASLCGSTTGSIINYTIAYRYGRKLFIEHQKFFFLTEEKLQKIEDFFRKHGPFSVFIGRMTYGVRHYISFPAGLARMPFKQFLRYTMCGDALWVTLLLSIGYFMGGNEELLKANLPLIKLAVFALVVSVVTLYIIKKRRQARRAK